MKFNSGSGYFNLTFFALSITESRLQILWQRSNLIKAQETEVELNNAIKNEFEQEDTVSLPMQITIYGTSFIR